MNSPESRRVWAVVPAAGRGLRFEVKGQPAITAEFDGLGSVEVYCR